MTEREAKPERFAPQQFRNNRWLILISIAVSLAALVGFLGIPGTGGNAVQKVEAKAGKVSIPLAGLSDGKAHFFSYAGGEGKIPFFVIKGTDGKVRAAFDACDVCFKAKKGYEQQGEQMICKNCNQAFPVAKIGEVSGGCNPSPIKTRLAGDALEIESAALEAGVGYFR